MISSKGQAIVDVVEDDRKLFLELDLSGIGASRITSRIYDLTDLTTLILRDNKLTRLSPNIQYLVQ